MSLKVGRAEQRGRGAAARNSRGQGMVDFCRHDPDAESTRVSRNEVPLL